MAAKPRCRICGHRPGPRHVTTTNKRGNGRDNIRVHKHPCHCDCHTHDDADKESDES